MLYISSAGIYGDRINERVERLALAGFRKIELSGGTKYYNEYLKDLLRLKRRYSLKYLVHNYFPPPQQGFILNLASLNKNIRNKSIDFCKKAIENSAVLGSPYYSVHAGFYFDPDIEELGRIIKPRKMYNSDKSQKAFTESLENLRQIAIKNGIKLFIENNVVNIDSYESLKQSIPSMLLCYDDVIEFRRSKPEYNFLLDIGHLKVTSHTLGIDFKSECFKLLALSDYLHLSDNSGLFDEHKLISRQSDIFKIIQGCDLSGKVVVLEIHDSIENIVISYKLIINAISRHNREAVK